MKEDSENKRKQSDRHFARDPLIAKQWAISMVESATGLGEIRTADSREGFVHKWAVWLHCQF